MEKGKGNILLGGGNERERERERESFTFVFSTYTSFRTHDYMFSSVPHF